MKFLIITLFLVLYFHVGISQAQDTKQKLLGIETGMNLISAKISNLDIIRGEIPHYPYSNSTSNVTSLMYNSYIGIKTEYYSFNNKLGIQGGIRISRSISSIGKSDYWTNGTNYFYMLYRQDGVNTEYMKVKEIKQSSSYIGVPIEFRYFPFNMDFLRPYFKLGIDISYCIKSQTNVVFYDDAMEAYQSDVADLIDEPKSVNSSIYGAGGFKIGKDSKPSVSIELCLPVIFLESESSGLLNPSAGGGFQINVQIPLKPRVQ